MKFWPTLFAAPMGAAAVACRAWKLNRSQTAGALATALAGSTATAPPAMMPDSSRCISLGFAAECGVRAAVAAKQGALGDPQLLETYAGRVAGVRVSPRLLLDGLGARFFFDEAGLKPYPVARQALAAVEACRQLVDHTPESISAITVAVPLAQQRIIDKPEWPLNRMQSIAGVQYQIALALLSPERLLDFDRTPPFETKELRTLASKVFVRADARLGKAYPASWPAQVTVARSGKRRSKLLRTPRGDAGDPLGWEDVFSKAAPYRTVLAAVKKADSAKPFPRALLGALPEGRNHKKHR
jgi:2-methylcitrate dehydratase PrpD